MITLPVVFLVYIGMAEMEADDKPWFICYCCTSVEAGRTYAVLYRTLTMRSDKLPVCPNLAYQHYEQYY